VAVSAQNFIKSHRKSRAKHGNNDRLNSEKVLINEKIQPVIEEM